MYKASAAEISIAGHMSEGLTQCPKRIGSEPHAWASVYGYLCRGCLWQKFNNKL